MSHFTVLAITNQTRRRSQETFEKDVATLLEPYCEGNEVPEYDKPCYCLGTKARDDVKCQSDKIFGTWDDMRTKFHNEITPKPSKPFEKMTDQEIGDFHDAQDKAWNELTKDKKGFEATAFSIHSLKDAPDSDCEECKGTGTYKSTYNPKSKWDWYQIGGRWDGACHEGGSNIFKVRELKGSTFAVVTPDGEWHERGKMGWFAIVSDENEGWENAFKKLVAKYGDNYAVLLDCHI